MVEPGDDADIREAPVYRETRLNVEPIEDGGAAKTSGVGGGNAVLGRGSKEDDDLRYLHLLWEPGRAERCGGGVASTLRKMTGSRARRQHRMARSLGPIGKEIYGKLL